jgi:hypothetical protein
MSKSKDHLDPTLPESNKNSGLENMGDSDVLKNLYIETMETNRILRGEILPLLRSILGNLNQQKTNPK